MRFGGYLAGLDPAEHYGFADWFEGLDFQIAWAKRFDWRCFLPTGFRDWNVDQQRVAVSKMADNDLVVPRTGSVSLQHHSSRPCCPSGPRGASLSLG